jgi:hypothetical protein
MADEVMVTAATMAVEEAHAAINQKVAAIATEMAVKAAAMAAAVAEAKTVAEGAAATLHQQLWQRWAQAMAGADNNQPKNSKNGG